MTSLPESPDLSETRLQEIDTLMCDGCGISAPVATGVGGGRHHCGGTFRPFVRDESLAAATARLSLFCAWGEKIDGTPRRKYTDGGGVYFIRRDIDAVLSALTAARADSERLDWFEANGGFTYEEGDREKRTSAGISYTYWCNRDALPHDWKLREIMDAVRSRPLEGQRDAD